MNKKGISLLGFFVLISTMIVQTPQALACSCVDGGPTAVFTNADVVFVGEVTGVRELKEDDPKFLVNKDYFGGRFEAEPPTITTFNIRRTWKGEKPKEILSVHNGASCTGYYFSPGKSYLVFANLADNGQVIQAKLCSGTRPLEYAQDYLAYLDSSETAEATGEGVMNEILPVPYINNGDDGDQPEPIYENGQFSERADLKENFNEELIIGVAFGGLIALISILFLHKK